MLLVMQLIFGPAAYRYGTSVASHTASFRGWRGPDKFSFFIKQPHQLMTPYRYGDEVIATQR